VLAAENFPSQTIQLLRQSNFEFENAEIIAKTGWTTDELQAAISQYYFKKRYDFITLLIGVNDQYRGRSAEDYKPRFESLLKQAIRLTNEKNNHVIVLSIPDWGVTPFAKKAGGDQQEIAREIDAFNSINKKIAQEYKVNYIDITPGTRLAADDLSLLAADGLHPSGKEYSKWSAKVASTILTLLN
jgi:lysophospholipase L1-like esterase